MQINSQPAEKQNLSFDTRDTLDIHSIFYTIQGEGPYAGQPSVFIRLAGCNIRCPGCDTEYTKGRSEMLSGEIVERVLEIRGASTLVVITGGEPFRQDFSKLAWMLADEDLRVQVETNGTLYIKGFPYGLTTIVCSPKAGKLSRNLIPHIKALKYVLSATSVGDDGLPLHVLGLPAKVARPPKDFKGTVYLQPMDEQDLVKNSDNMKAVVKMVQKFGYTLCLQMHKIINVE